MAEIKIKPVFEWIDGKWKLITLDCPFGCGGLLEFLSEQDKWALFAKKYYACSGCGRVLRIFSFGSSPDWRILQ